MNEILTALKACLGPDALPREGQLEAIDSIVNKRERVLVVQKTVQFALASIFCKG